MWWNLFLDIVLAVIVLGAIPIIISLEYYAKKTKVTAVSSVPWMRKAVLEVLKEKAHNHKSDSDLIIYELGSGWGPLAIDAAKAFPESKVIGLELSPIPLWFSRVRSKLWGIQNIEWRRCDFFDVDLSDADIVIFYMLESILERLKPKFEEEFKLGTIVISNTFEVRGWEPNDVKTVMSKPIPLKVYTYIVPEKKK